MGFADIHVIDMDTIDVSNLNRQFLFRFVFRFPQHFPRTKLIPPFEQPEGRRQVEGIDSGGVCDGARSRLQGYSVRPFPLFSLRFPRVSSRCFHSYHGKIQDKDDDYYMQFTLVICGLDSVDARRWINATLVNLVDPENPESLKPLIDGGTEGTLLFSLPLHAELTRFSRRLQGSSPCHAPDHYLLLRMLYRNPHPSDRLPHLHNRQHPSSPRTLHRVGEHS
jgi:hypothetical protein